MNFFNFAETAMIDRRPRRVRLLIAIVLNGRKIERESLVTLPPAILGTLSPGEDYELPEDSADPTAPSHSES